MDLKNKWNTNGSVKRISTQTLPVHIPSEEEIANDNLIQINQYFVQNARVPSLNRLDKKEYELADKLMNLRHNKGRFPTLEVVDIYNLLEH